MFLIVIVQLFFPMFMKKGARTSSCLSDEDFSLTFRRASLVPDEINHHRFGKLIIDLNRQIGGDRLFAGLQSRKEAGGDVKAISAAWEARKRVIENQVRRGSHHESGGVS